MDFVSSSEYLVWIAKWAALISFILVGVVTTLTLLIRLRLNMRRRRKTRIHEMWQPILVECIDGMPEHIPTLTTGSIPTFLVLWNYYHETLRDSGLESLNAVARELDLNKWSISALKRGSIRDRLLAIQTLGWLKEEGAWDQLRVVMETGDPVVSLCAAKALHRIDAKKAIKLFIPLVAATPDWSFSTVGKLLQEMGPAIVTKTLSDAILNHRGDERLRLLRYLDTGYEEIMSPLISELLDTSKTPLVIVALLRASNHPRDLPNIREFLNHEDWRVRTQAATRLGETGTEDDIERLAHATGDQVWWVRFRSANALAQLPSVTNEMLRELASNHVNIFGSEVIEQVRLEKEAYL